MFGGPDFLSVVGVVNKDVDYSSSYLPWYCLDRKEL